MELNSVNVSLIVGFSALFGVALTAIVNIIVNQINRHKSYNEWRRDKLYNTIVIMKKALDEAQSQNYNLMSSMERLDEEDSKQQMYLNLSSTVSHIYDMQFLLNKNEREILYRKFLVHIDNEVNFFIAAKKGSKELVKNLKNSQDFIDYLSDLIYKMK